MRTIPLLLAILWLLLGYFHNNSSNQCCNATGTSSTTEKAAAAATAATAATTTTTAIKNAVGPLMSFWDKGAVTSGDSWAAKKKQLIDGLKDNQILEIAGLYRSDEKNDTKFENLGLARADEAAKLMSPPLSKDKVRLVGKLITGEIDKTKPFSSVSFRNLINTENIKEVDDKTIIRFPYNSTNKLNSREVESYLNDVADRVKKSGERVRLTGHTDSMGSTESNRVLGQRRAAIIKNYLMKRGVSASKIVATSKGETSPIANNGSKAGRAENRRTELQIIK